MGLGLALGLGLAGCCRLHFFGTARVEGDLREDGRLHFNGYVDSLGLAHTTGVREVLGASSRFGESRFLDFSATLGVGDDDLGTLASGLEVVVLLTRGSEELEV